MIFGRDYEPRKSTLYYFLQPSITSSLLGPWMSLSFLFSLFISLRTRYLPHYPIIFSQTFYNFIVLRPKYPQTILFSNNLKPPFSGSNSGTSFSEIWWIYLKLIYSLLYCLRRQANVYSSHCANSDPQPTFAVSMKLWLHSDMCFWVPFSWIQRILRV
jgi:hypothetical protein